MIKFIIVLILIYSFNAQAVCTPTPDCTNMGYTETSCEGTSLKCPFDTSKLHCVPCDSSFKYSSIGDNITQGIGTTCGNKYVTCECSSADYIFSNGECVCDTSCKVGAIYYSDGSCSSCVDNTKTPVGIVVKDNELISSTNLQLMPWGGYGTDLSQLENFDTTDTNAYTDYLGYSNTMYIVEKFGETDTANFAGIYCYNYAPTDMENTKKSWYLPSAGEINNTLTKHYSLIKSTWNKLGITLPNYAFWSSTEYDHRYAWHIFALNGDGYRDDKPVSYTVTCFLKI